MFGFFLKKSKIEEPNEVARVCDHENWEVWGTNTIGFGTCLDCHEQVPLDYLFNKLHAKMDAAISEAMNECKAIRDMHSNEPSSPAAEGSPRGARG